MLSPRSLAYIQIYLFFRLAYEKTRAQAWSRKLMAYIDSDYIEAKKSKGPALLRSLNFRPHQE
jgi:hypothetical protein